MKQRTDLLTQSIFKSLVALSIPIMATSLFQMAYNMIDMIWIGRMGSNSVAAIGAAGMFINFTFGLAGCIRVGSQVNVAQSFGAGRYERAATFTRTAIQSGAILSIIAGIILSVFRGPFISFFGFTNEKVINDAEIYLLFMGSLLIFSILNLICTAVITATGNSKTPFILNTVGLVTNVILDPVLIFGFGIIPALEVAGAAIATVFSNLIVLVLQLLYMRKDKQVFSLMNFRLPIKGEYLQPIVRIGLPAAVQGMMFNCIAMAIGRIVAIWGETAIAVQKVGVQIESISWMTADGFATATSSFIGQNYGAGRNDRAKEGYFTALKVMICWGIFTSCILIFTPAPIFRIFITEADVIPLGVDYLRIIGFSQLFMCIEILTSGAFAAYGKTLPPSVVSVTFTTLRIPMAILLGKTALGLNGVWASISLSSVFKGVILLTLFVIFMKKQEKKEK